MTITVSDVAFQIIYVIAATAAGTFAVQATRYWRRHRFWGPGIVACHFWAKTLFMADLAFLRLRAADPDGTFGVNGVTTFVIRVLWMVTFVVMVIATLRGHVLEHLDGDTEPWDGDERRTRIRRAVDRGTSSPLQELIREREAES